MTAAADRLRDSRRRAGYESAAAAEAYGWKIAAYRHHENGTRAFDIDAAKRYARAFKVDPAWLLGLATASAPKHLQQQENEVEVIASVAAGVWREETEWEPERRFTIAVGQSPFPGARRYGLHVEGFSMDLEFPPGTILDCVSIHGLGLEPESGDHVVVERRRGDGRRELTVKRYHVDEEGRKWLVPESTRPEFQGPIEVAEPDEDMEVQVIAYVIGSYQPRSLRLLQRSRAIVGEAD